MMTTIVVIPYFDPLVIPHCWGAINPRDWRGIVARMMTTGIADAINHHGPPPHPTLSPGMFYNVTQKDVFNTI